MIGCLEFKEVNTLKYFEYRSRFAKFPALSFCDDADKLEEGYIQCFLAVDTFGHGAYIGCGYMLVGGVLRDVFTTGDDPNLQMMAIGDAVTTADADLPF